MADPETPSLNPETNNNNHDVDQRRGDIANRAAAEAGRQPSESDLGMRPNETVQEYLERLKGYKNEKERRDRLSVERTALEAALETGAIDHVVEQGVRAQERKELQEAIEQRPAPETISEEQVKKTAERAKRSGKWKQFVAAITLTVTLVGSIIAPAVANYISSRAPAAPTGIEQVDTDLNGLEGTIGTTNESERTYEELTGYEAFDSRIDGSFEQYDNPGCYDDKEGKYSPTSVANVESALQLIGKTMETATPEEIGAALEYVTYCQRETAAYTAISHNLTITDDDGNTINFSELSYEEASELIRNMSPEEKDRLQNELHRTFENATYEFGEANGPNTNSYIEEDENGEKHPTFNTIDVNGVKTVIQTVRHEDGTTTIATFMARCFNGDKAVVRVNKDGSEYEIVIRLTPDEPTTPDTPDTPDTPIEPKNSENLTRIDEQAHEDIADDIGTEEVRVTPTPSSEVESQTPTPKPSSESYEGTSATTTQNTASQSAQPVQPTSPTNNYSVDNGRANPLPDNAVQPDTTTPPLTEETPPTTPEEASDVLSDLGIN